LLAATLQGAIFAVVKAAVAHGAADGTGRLTGIWASDEGEQPTSRMTAWFAGCRLRYQTISYGRSRADPESTSRAV
jgi:hypothetical protein